jgi:uncharacterized protein
MKTFSRFRIRAGAFLLAALLLAGGCAWLDRKQGELIFNPVQGEWRGYRGLPEGMQEVWVAVGANGDKLHAWWSPASDPGAPALLYLHGARWNLTGSVTRIPRWNKMGFSVLAIDYRGFGKSVSSDASVPTERSAQEDAQAAFAKLTELAPAARRFIFGHSLGGSIATDLAVRRPDANGLILEGAFTNIADMIRETRWGFLPVGFLVTQRFDTLDRIDEVKMPVLVAHATAPKKFFRATGGNHHNMTAAFFDDYAGAVREHFRLGPATRTAAGSGMPADTATK